MARKSGFFPACRHRQLAERLCRETSDFLTRRLGFRSAAERRHHQSQMQRLRPTVVACGYTRLLRSLIAGSFTVLVAPSQAHSEDIEPSRNYSFFTFITGCW